MTRISPVLIIIIAGFFDSEEIRMPFGKSVKIDRFHKCRQYPNLIASFENTHLSPVNKMLYVSGKMVALRDMSRHLRLVLSIERCKSKENLDSCEEYNDISFTKFCDMAFMNFQPWTPLLNSFKPPMPCPVRKGTYVLQNGSLDGEALSVIPISDTFWKVYAKLYEDEDKGAILVMCTYVEGQIMRD